jgi:hypothetical protein
MPLLNLRRRKPASPSDAVFKAAVEGAAKAVLMSSTGKRPGTSWSNQGSTSSALIARVSNALASDFQRPTEEVEAALAEHGLTWGPPFPPGRPLDPFWGYRRPPRTMDFAVGENVQLTPRWNRIAFPTLKAIIESYYAAQICIRHLINDVRSLDYQFVPPQNVVEDATDDLQKAEEFFASPDKRQPFRAWLAEYLQDVLRYDAGALYVRRNDASDPIALEVVTGPSIIPLIDFFGRPPADESAVDAIPEGIWEGDTVPAFVQIVEGLPWVWLTRDDLIYQPLNPLPESQYGLAPMEAVLLQANTDIRFQWHFLQYFTEGSMPAGFMEAPPDLSDPEQVAEWQDTWDAIMLGDQSKLRQIRWVPAGAKFTPTKDGAFDDAFPLYLMRCTAAAFGVTPNDLGFTEDVNRSTGAIQVDVQFRVGTLPLIRHVEDVINLFISEFLHLKAKIQFDIGREVEDLLTRAQADDIYVKNGTISNDEIRVRLGKRVSRDRPIPRYIDNTRSGPVPLLALTSLAGKIDATTYGPDKSQKLVDHPYANAAGVNPVIGSADYKGALDTTAGQQLDLIHDTTGTVTHVLATPPPLEKPSAEKMLDEALGWIDYLLNKDGGVGSNIGGPNVPGGITASTGVQGVDLIGDEEDEEDEVCKAGHLPLLPYGEKRLLRQWKENSLNRVKKGLPPRRFSDLPFALSDPIWRDLEPARTREEVIAAFATAGKAMAPTGA